MDTFTKSKVKEIDARYFGMSKAEMVENAGKALAEKLLNEIITKFPGKAGQIKISIICGLGNNGADGMSCAREIGKMLINNETKNRNFIINTYLIGREQDLKTSEAKEQFSKLKESIKKIKDSSSINLISDAYAKDIGPSDIILEAILGSGIKGKLHKRFKDVVDKIARMKTLKIAVDSPVPGYRADKVFSFLYAKTKNAEILDLHLPNETKNFIGPGIISTLYTPPKNSHKSQNGELLIFGGSELFHGAPIMAIRAASKFIGSVFFYTDPENRELIQKQKMEVQEFISLREQDLEKYAEYADVVLAGPGLEDNIANQAVLTHLLNKFTDKSFVLDAYAIALANPAFNPLNKRGFKNCILTPHRGELRHLFPQVKTEGLEGRLKRFCIENKCMLVLKGHIDILFNENGETLMNRTGNAGMAKGGTGDVLAGMIASLACKNPLWEALQAGVFLNGLAGDMLKKEFSSNYSATDLIPMLQKAYKVALDFAN